MVKLNYVAGAIALIHVYVFALESLLWKKPWVAKAFKMSPADSKANTTFAFNQGFYNLFLSIAIVAGVVFGERPLVDYGVLSVFGAGLVLFISQRKLWRPALIQMGPAVIYFALRLGSF